MEEKVEEEARASELESSVGLHPHGKLLSSYLGLSFSLFLALLPSSSSISQLSTLHLKLLQAEQELCRLKSHRKEDSKANARVVEIFAGHREGWRREEKRMVDQIHAAAEEIACLRARVAELERSEAELKTRVEELTREVGEREEMLGFVAREREEMLGFVARESQYACLDDGKVRLPAEAAEEEEEVGTVYGQPEFVASASKLWSAGGGLWQDVQYEPVESLYHMKHFVARRESPWKVDGESTGVSSKLKLLEQELLNLERVGKSDLSKVPSLMRKQAKRYQALSGKIDDLCQRMQASDPCDPTLSSEFRTQRQTEFLLEAFRLQQRASETSQKFMALQTETGKSRMGGGGGEELGLSTKRSLDSIRNNLKEIQRNLEIWLARIIGDLEGILARDGASRVREYYISRYPFVQ
ncbi:LOW QUALITY PROTEIN: myosin-14-like [Vitis riparia]|uniref:LOW QUALITY PROTEIN: myosin-14-like n=1 Tax=Vitis riparia TaxID=96939 RepID=UPI00155B2A4F|nr:LOW QUALITY PROTEIN: myosin-14-like [Vitis riparia]